MTFLQAWQGSAWSRPANVRGLRFRRPNTGTFTVTRNSVCHGLPVTVIITGSVSAIPHRLNQISVRDIAGPLIPPSRASKRIRMTRGERPPPSPNGSRLHRPEQSSPAVRDTFQRIHCLDGESQSVLECTYTIGSLWTGCLTRTFFTARARQPQLAPAGDQGSRHGTSFTFLRRHSRFRERPAQHPARRSTGARS